MKERLFTATVVREVTPMFRDGKSPEPRPHVIVPVLVLVGLFVGTAGCDMDTLEEVSHEQHDSIILDVRTWAYIGWDEVVLTDAQVTVHAVSYAHGIKMDDKTLRETTDLQGNCSIFVSLKVNLDDIESHPYYREDGQTFVSMTVSATWDNGVTPTYKGSKELSFDAPYPERWVLWMWLDRGESEHTSGDRL